MSWLPSADHWSTLEMRLSLIIYLIATTIAMGRTGVAMAAADLPSESTQVDQLFTEWDKPTSPGCALAIMRDGHIIYERGYGMADLDHDVKITPTTVFHVASMSKQFTAASVLLLAQEGKLALDDQATKFVPELPNFGVPITLRHLLHHTSGLRDQWELLGLAGWRLTLDLITDADVLAVLSRQKALNFPPGSKFLYSNTGYTLLAQVVKHVNGQSFRTFTSNRIFLPLGMSHTHFRDDHAEIVKDIAYGYAPHNGGFGLSITNFDTVGATSLLTTVEDLALWDENFYTARVGGEALVKQLQERGYLNDGTQLSYAAGLEIGKYRGLNIISHAGTDAGYRADLIRFPDQHFSVALLCNLASIDPGTLSRRIADIYLAPSFSASSPPTTVPTLSPQPSSEQLKKWVGLYVSPDDSDRIMRVRLGDGHLQSGLNVDGRVSDLEATDVARFRYIKEPATELVFQAGENGAPPTLTTYIGGQVQYHYSRVPSYDLTVTQLQEFTGVYRSDEVDMPYEVILGDGKLLVRSLKSNEIPLLPVSTDLFSGRGNRIRFTRDPQGKVTGALLSTSRVYNFRFERSQ
jgi:CubicO group peptidase (beta-lactamase class C family)